MGYRIITVGTSLGGFRALSTILGELPKDFPLPIAISQHRSAEDSEPFIDLLARQTALPVSEVEDKDELRPGFVHLCPPNYHLLVERDHFSLSADSPVLSARPSINVLFESAADSWSNGVIGILLTGNSRDGADGLAKIKNYGGLTIVQDPATAEAPLMPTSAVSSLTVDRVLPLEKIGLFLVEVVGVQETRLSEK